MMETDPIRIDRIVAVPAPQAFDMFAGRLAVWWPREYTWGRGDLATIGIEPRPDGRCYERRTDGAETVWGQVLTWDPPRGLAFSWQIRLDRTPESDPARASVVEVRFMPEGQGATRVTLVHRAFDRHGAGAADYCAALASPQGWPCILDRYAAAFG